MESVSSFPWNTHASSLIRPVMLGLGGFPSSWPLQDHKRPLSFRGLLSATDPLLPDDIFMGNVGLLITKLTYICDLGAGCSSANPDIGLQFSAGRQPGGKPPFSL